MKKIISVFFLLLFAVLTHGFAQTTTTPTPAIVTKDTTTLTKDSADFFAGKWELNVLGTPNGDAKLILNLTRKDSKLTGFLTDPAKPTEEKIPLTNVEEGKENIVIYFTAQGYDVSDNLVKVDANKLKGMLMDMFDSTATRLPDK